MRCAGCGVRDAVHGARDAVHGARDAVRSVLIIRMIYIVLAYLTFLIDSRLIPIIIAHLFH